MYNKHKKIMYSLAIMSTGIHRSVMYNIDSQER